jgi:ParB family chromosome partitioning protein
LEVKEIRLNLINVSSLNTRKDLGAGTEDTSLADLALSIKEKGLLNPITVLEREDGRYDLIIGQRRFLACKQLGLETIPAIVRDRMDDTDATILSLVENVHRADMSPIDKARAYKTIYQKYEDYANVARETGVAIATIKKYMMLLDLAPSIQESLTTSDGPAGIGTLSKLAESFKSPEEQERVLEAISGFKQDIQLKIIKQSEGNLSQISNLKEKALQGAFNTVICHGIEDCTFIPKRLREPIRQMIEKEKNET